MVSAKCGSREYQRDLTPSCVCGNNLERILNILFFVVDQRTMYCSMLLLSSSPVPSLGQRDGGKVGLTHGARRTSLQGRRRRKDGHVTRSTVIMPEVQEICQVAEGLELPVQLLYLSTLLGFLSVGAFVVVRQVLVKRELEETAKAIGERVRNQEASPEDYYELWVILLRKKLFTQANANLKKSLKNWDEENGDEEVHAQVHNALGYSYFNLGRFEDAIKEYTKAVEMQPGYLTAWNNLGDVLEKQKRYSGALEAYQEVLGLDPSNTVAKERASYCRTRVERSQGML